MQSRLLLIKEFKIFLGAKVWALFLFSIFLGALWFGVELLFVYVLQCFLNALNLLDAKSVQIPDFLPTTLSSSMVLLVSFGLVRAIVYVLKEYYSGITNQTFIREKRHQLMDYCINNANIINKHDVVTIFNERIAQSGSLIQQISSSIHISTSSILLFFYGLTLAPKELLIGTLLLGCLLIPLRFLDNLISKLGNAIVTESSLMNKILLLGLQNHFFLKIYNLLNIEIDKGSGSLGRYEDQYRKHFLYSNLKSALPMFGGVVIIAIMCYAGIKYFHTPEIKLLALFYIFIRMAQSFGLLAVTIANMKFNYKGFSILYEWHKRHLEYSKKNNTKIAMAESFIPNSYQIFKDLVIEAKDLTFSYPGQKPILNNINFTIKTNDILLIKGRSGSGKSTLLNLLMGLEIPNSGEITISGHKTQIAMPNLSGYLGYVGPDPYLIPGTVRENLIYGTSEDFLTSDEKIWNVLKSAQLVATIRALPNQLDEVLNELTQLSTGQKQRLSMARALLRDPKILILDEATANIDMETEQKFIETLQRISQSLLTVVISHKDSFNEVATHTLDIENSNTSK